MFDLRKVQAGREITEQEILAINYVVKRRARRYIAAAKKEWLYPEKYMKKMLWNKIGSKFFLMPDPRKVSFTTGIYMGDDKGRVWAQDEYGRIPDDKNPKVIEKRHRERQAFDSFRRAWDTIYGPLEEEVDGKDRA